MQSKDTIKMAIEMAFGMTFPLLEDLKDAPLTQPTSNGGNHAMWVAGHLAFAGGHLLWDIMRGEENPLAEWAELFGPGSEPTVDADRYPAYDDVLARLSQVHADVVTLLDTMNEEDLDQASKQAPEGFEAFFGTYRQCFLVNSIHLASHRGQVSDCRRALGRKPVMA